MSHHPTRRALLAAGSAAVTAALAVTVPAPALAAAPIAFGGSAYGSTARVGSTANSGKTSYVTLCTTRTGKTGTNRTAAVTLPGVGVVGAATTTVSSRKSTHSVYSSTTTRTAGTSLLSGLIQASVLTSTARVTRTSKGYATTGSTVVTGLRVAGVPVSTRPRANSTITLPGIATVRLNSQSGTTSGGVHSKNVVAMRVTLLEGNPLDLPVGTIVVGSANANLHTPTHRRPYGSAYGSYVNLAGVVKSGQTASVVLPCGGTSKTRTNTVASVHLGSALDVGAVHSSGVSSDTRKRTVARTTTRVAGANLLGDVVHVDAVTAKATTTRTGSTLTRSSAGTSIVGLRINGVRRSVSSAENQQIGIAGVGTLYLRRAVRSGTSLQVYAVQLKLNTAVSGLDAGTTLTLGSAKAGVSAR